MEKRVLVPIADGTEEIEAVSIIDVLRRAEAKVTVASVSGKPQITASRGVVLAADCLIDACESETFDLIALPGGMPGATNLAQCPPLIRMLQDQRQAGRLYAAICAAPAVVFRPNGLLDGVKATCFPSMQGQLDPAWLSCEGVVKDKNCITAQGPGFALKFSLELVERLFSREKRRIIEKALLRA